MLHMVRENYEQHHGVKITDEAIEAAVKLSDRYINDRFLPDKAIDVMDEAASSLRLEAIEQRHCIGPRCVSALERELAEDSGARRRPRRWPRSTSGRPSCASAS